MNISKEILDKVALGLSKFAYEETARLKHEEGIEIKLKTVAELREETG